MMEAIKSPKLTMRVLFVLATMVGIMAASSLSGSSGVLGTKEASAALAHHTGYIGSHAHGQLYCGNYGKIYLFGNGGYERFRASSHQTSGNLNEKDWVTYRAHLYRWNSQYQYWAYQTSTRTFDKTVSGYASDLGFPNIGDPAFVVGRGHYMVSTEIHWFQSYGYSYLGSANNAWAQGMCTYG